MAANFEPARSGVSIVSIVVMEDMNMETLNRKLDLLRSTSGSILERFQNSDAKGIEELKDAVRLGLSVQLDAIISEIITLGLKEYQVGSSLEERIKVVHYTSIDVLVKMFESLMPGRERNFLRLYDTLHFNDPEEGKYLLENITDDRRQNLISASSPFAYVASFVEVAQDDSERDVSDDLYFWRAYGRDGRGCALTLNLPARILLRVKYGPLKDYDASARSIEDGIRDYIASVKDALDPILNIVSENADVGELQSFLRGKLNEMTIGIYGVRLYLHKSEAYKYEQEVRVVEITPGIRKQSNEPIFEYHGQDIAGGFKVRHYREHPCLRADNLLNTGSVVTLGPCVSDKESLEYYLDHLKRKTGFVGTAIRRSRVSYRND